MTLFKTWLKDRESDETSSDAFDARMSALYADLSVRKSSDRLAFEAALEWWRHLLSDFCMSGVQSSVSAHNQQQPTALRKEKDRLTLRCDQRLLDDLTLEDVGRPIGIGTVLVSLQQAHICNTEIYSSYVQMEMQNTSCAHRLDQFLTNNKPVSGPTKRSRSISLRALSIAAMPLVWAFSQLSLNLGLNEHESDASESDWRKAQGEWVLWDSVEVSLLTARLLEGQLTSLLSETVQCDTKLSSLSVVPLTTG
jgi:charged multivesicular body protein 7